MSDFLQHLLERAEGQGPQLVRRKPSLYEPRSFDVEGLAEETGEYERASRTPPPVERQEPAAPTSPALLHQPTREAASQSPSPRSEQGAALDRPHRLTAVAEPVENAFRASAPDPVPMPRIETHHTETIRERSEIRVIERRESVRESVVDRLAVVERLGTVVREPAPVPLADATVRSSTRVQNGERPASRPSTSAARPVPVTNMVHQRTARVAAGLSSPDPAPPQVTISIGRLEIRPPAHASPSRPNRTKMPQLSLDDYLRTRNGGTR